MTYHELADAVAEANRPDYGLVGYVCGADMRACLETAQAVQCGTVVINAGSTGGVNVGDRFKVYREGEELIDPTTGLNLGSLEAQIGEIEVVNNTVGDGKASQCKVISGEGFERGDIVRAD